MKKLLFVFLMASGAVAVANNTDPEPSTLQGKSAATQAAKYTKAVKGAGLKNIAPKDNICRSGMQTNMSRMDLSLYFVEMVNSNNLKLIKKILD
ncbi:MAG: hypothetical protein EOO45_09285 [Flavobacterium sp.]|nr:MAG: hypothetical protein EOO45_09285 [Flavobacterium sp.]